jgi:tetratricopeptide (TPR) repeat protein
MLLAFIRDAVLEHTLSEEEHSQIVQTIEMFEVILQTQPDDYQSLEILKEAYAKVGRTVDSLKTSRRLAEAYFNSGSYTMAMQECEAILVKEPNAPEILAMLGDIETRLHKAGEQIVAGGSKTGLIAPAGVNGVNGLTHGSAQQGALVDIQTNRQPANLHDRGDEHLAKFLVMQQLCSEEDVANAMGAVQQFNKDLTGQALAASLLDKIYQQDRNKLEAAISGLIDRTKFAYVPLEYYDVDRQIPRMLPDHLTLGRLFLPFDLISRTIMIACCNPFDAAGRDAVQQSLDYTVTWYLAQPASIIKALQDVYRLESRA